jgi:hypothetical protein
MRWKFFVAAAAVMTMVLGGYVGAAGAATRTRIIGYDQIRDRYPTTQEDAENERLWFREDTRTGGSVTLASHFGAPDTPEGEADLGSGSLVLTTNAKNFAKAQLINHSMAGTPVSDVQELTYWTYQSADDANPPGATGSANDNASYQLQVDIDGDLNTTGDFVNLVYETYWNDTEGNDPQQPLAPGVWQYWNATEGDWWASKPITCDDFTLGAGSGGPPFTRPSEIGAECPSAVVVGIGVNVGSYNPNHIVGVDGVSFTSSADDVTWNFEPK